MHKHLDLEVNAAKSGAHRTEETALLGFRIHPGGPVSPAPKAIERLKERVRMLWDARQSLTTQQLRDQWQRYITGWWNYCRRPPSAENRHPQSLRTDSTVDARGLRPLGSTAGCGKPHVRWCGRGDGRNPVTPTRSGAGAVGSAARTAHRPPAALPADQHSPAPPMQTAAASTPSVPSHRW